MHSNAEAIEETCRKLAATGMHAVLSPQASRSSITRSASGNAAASDLKQEAASHQLQPSAANSPHPSSAPIPPGDDVDKPQSMPPTACFAASSMQGSLHPKSPSPGTPSQASPTKLPLTGTGCEITEGTSGAACGGQEEGASPFLGRAHQLQGSPSNAIFSETVGSQAADKIEVKESNQGSPLVQPVCSFAIHSCLLVLVMSGDV